MTDGVSLERVKDVLPLLPLKDVVIFPQMVLPVFISEEICLKAVEAACAKERRLFLSVFQVERCPLKDPSIPLEWRVSTPPPFDVYDIGVIANVLRTRKLPDGRTKVLIQGLSRAVVQHLKQTDPYPLVQVKIQPEAPDSLSTAESKEKIKEVKDYLDKLITLNSKVIAPDILMVLGTITDMGKYADLIASHVDFKIEETQTILGTFEKKKRLEKIHELLRRFYESHTTTSKSIFGNKEEGNRNLKDQFLKDQFLKDQLRNLKHDLGEGESKDELEDLRRKIEHAGMSQEALSESLKQLKRLERMNPDSSEASQVRTYLDWMVELPWNRFSEEKIEMSQCRKILDEDHYGLQKIKDRILEYIAVRKLNPILKAPILCFVGPPGVGKTSLGKSISRALGRKFSRISLGGVRDEAEIRGHRRTYVGAMPGRILQALKNVDSRNPVLMLDEIDKLGSDHKGDPSSALLEVLDPEQNNTFSDHYISVPFDLSQIIFLANANRLETIPAPLRDRLELIEVSGYSEEEKFEISKQYIVPKSIQQNGLTQELIQFHDSTVNFIINSYTRESGLRQLEKQISAVVRKLARYVAENDEFGKERKSIRVSSKMAKKLLGEEKFMGDEHDIHKKIVGSCVGLAYTQTGGDLLSLEVKLIPGTAKLTLTGQLGDVMKESAQIALSCVRSYAEKWNVDSTILKEKEIHLHVPSGATPKDGPSAGVAIVLALFSAIKQEPIRQDMAVTGEITLQGNILPIGGVREKILAALRYGLKTVCLPEKNRGTFCELPITMRRKIQVRFVSTIEDVLSIYFDKGDVISPHLSDRFSEVTDISTLIEQSFEA